MVLVPPPSIILQLKVCYCWMVPPGIHTWGKSQEMGKSPMDGWMDGWRAMKERGQESVVVEQVILHLPFLLNVIFSSIPPFLGTGENYIFTFFTFRFIWFVLFFIFVRSFISGEREEASLPSKLSCPCPSFTSFHPSVHEFIIHSSFMNRRSKEKDLFPTTDTPQDSPSQAVSCSG